MAEDLLQVWMNHAHRHLSHLRTLHPAADPLMTPNTSTLFESLKIATGGDLCYAKFVFRNGEVVMDDAFVKHCSDKGLAYQALQK